MVNENRDALLKKYPTFQSFKQNFTNDEKFMKEFFQYISKEDPKLTFKEDQYKISERIIKLRLKSYLAQDLWGLNEFYEIFNASNEALDKAVKVLNSKEYEKMNLDKK